jgi:hypothetical protein
MARTPLGKKCSFWLRHGTSTVRRLGSKQDALVEALRAKGAPRKTFRDAKRRAQDDHPRSSIILPLLQLESM